MLTWQVWLAGAGCGTVAAIAAFTVYAHWKRGRAYFYQISIKKI